MCVKKNIVSICMVPHFLAFKFDEELFTEKCNLYDFFIENSLDNNRILLTELCHKYFLVPYTV